jgi:prepilin-type N-terminal cleavage/methylation domain-containing protein
MNNEQKNSGFSLTEVLIAVGILAVGMVFIAGVFPAALYYATVATERTIAAVAADEAFAKIKIYAVGDPSITTDDVNLANLTQNNMMDFNDPCVFPATTGIDPNEFAYPSDPCIDVSQKQYFWSALCRRVDFDPNRLVQVTVFVSRKVSPNLEYYCPDPCGSGGVDWLTPDVTKRPVPVKVKVNVSVTNNNELTIINTTNEKPFINDGCTIVDDATGRIYRVLERYKPPNDATILLDGQWQGAPGTVDVWAVPPPVTYGRYPCIAVYQKLIRF